MLLIKELETLANMLPGSSQHELFLDFSRLSKESNCDPRNIIKKLISSDQINADMQRITSF